MPASVVPSSLAHDLENHHAVPVAVPRAKTISRPAQAVAARIFSAACDRSGLSNVVIAKWLGIDERRVREMRMGLRPVSLEQLLTVPPGIEATVGEALQAHSKVRAIR